MLTNPVLLLAALAASATASYHGAIHPGALAAKRDLVARQSAASTTDDGTAAATSCLSGILSIYSSLPTPPPEIVSWEESATFTDPCSITIPASISAAFSSYESEYLTWYTDHSSELFSALSQCPQYSSVGGGGGGGGSSPPVCTGGAAGGGGGGAGKTTTATTTGTTTKTSGMTAATTGASNSGTSTSAGAAASTHSNAGPRETGFVAGAVAVAGFLGVVAAL